MLGQEEIDNFWTDVERRLAKDRPNTTPEDRLRGIIRYRNALAIGAVNKMVYHREPEDVAHDIEVGEFVARR